jgi:sugar phosphate isomerase/epimerase
VGIGAVRSHDPEGACGMLCSISTKLGDKDLKEIGALEERLGVTLLAFNCHPLDPAAIDEGQLTKIKALEEKLGVSLVAVAS